MKIQMKIKQWIILIICTVICLLSVDNVFSQEAKELLTGHAFYIPTNNIQTIEISPAPLGLMSHVITGAKPTP
jgi:hypothetical protein